MVNTTHLRRRITKFIDAEPGRTVGRLSLECSNGTDGGLIRRFRNGSELREGTLQRIDEYLQERGF